MRVARPLPPSEGMGNVHLDVLRYYLVEIRSRHFLDVLKCGLEVQRRREVKPTIVFSGDGALFKALSQQAVDFGRKPPHKKAESTAMSMLFGR